ncbi:MAG: hypothetical protein RLN94_13395 [Roseovarius sp.]|uniref:hypothetical protein n=1 Tax=Roseovarius sp. TaxID=1486281 RepID=UPI0032EEB4A8
MSADDRDAAQHRQTTQAAPRQQEARLVLTPAQRVDEPEEDEAAADMDIEAPETRQQDESRFDGIEDAEIVEARSRGEDADAEILKDLPQFIRSGMRDDPGAPQSGQGTSEEALSQDEPAAPADTDAELREDWDDAEDEAALTDSLQPEDDREAAGAHTEYFEDADDAEDEIDLKELEARIAGFETAVAEKDDQWEPDGASDDDYAAAPQSPLPWQDVEEDETAEDLSAYAYDPEPELEPEAPLAQDRFEEAPAASTEPDSLEERRQAPQGAGDDAGWYSDDAVLDEDALRDMVSEIVRQELQGALGERITRNVRKLVRREIHRALMTQGID